MGYAEVEYRDRVAVIWLDQEGEKINKLSVDLVEMFHELLDELEVQDDVRGVVLISRKPDNFIAGADLERFLQIEKAGEAAEMSRKGHELLRRMDHFPKPIVAAVHGAALGGGCEVALACHYRIAGDDWKTVFGQPEVRLGLLPAGGGTQRLPRLVGLQKALELMLSGRTVPAKEALRIGLVDALIHPYGLLDAACRAAEEISEKPFRRKKKLPRWQQWLEALPPARRWIYRKARQNVLRKTAGNYPAPLKIIDCVQAGLEQGEEAGYGAEAEHFDALMLSPQAKSLIRLFFQVNQRKKNPFEAEVRPVQRIGILGAGLMGSGIATVSIKADFDVVMKDVNYAAVGRGEKAVWQALERDRRRGRLSHFERDRTFSRLHGTIDVALLRRCELVIEAVFEDLDLKHRVLQEVEEVAPEQCIFASNTSSIPISKIAEAAKRPEQVIGMHYFSPVPRMPLLEIVVTPKTADWVRATAFDVGSRQGKTCIVVNDGPGFYTTRILAPMLNEVFCLLDEGAAVEEIDRAMVRFGFPVGPVTLLDEVGIDVAEHVTRVMSDFFAARGVTSHQGIFQIYEAGFRGRKNRKGFYRYDRRNKRKEVNREVYRYFGGASRKPFLEREIQERLSLVVLNEAVLCLQDGILQSPEDGDVGAVLGLGFPPFLGGPFRYIESLGEGNVVSLLEKYQHKHGARFQPATLLVDMAKNQKRFYEM